MSSQEEREGGREGGRDGGREGGGGGTFIPKDYIRPDHHRSLVIA